MHHVACAGVGDVLDGRWGSPQGRRAANVPSIVAGWTLILEGLTSGEKLTDTGKDLTWHCAKDE